MERTLCLTPSDVNRPRLPCPLYFAVCVYSFFCRPFFHIFPNKINPYQSPALDAKTRVPSAEKPELSNDLSFSRSGLEYSFVRFARCQEFYFPKVCLLGPFSSIFPNSPPTESDVCIGQRVGFLRFVNGHRS